MNSEPGTLCPKCKAESPCTDWDEVDVGIGSIRGNHTYTCPEHGDFGWGNSGDGPSFRDAYVRKRRWPVCVPFEIAETPSRKRRRKKRERRERRMRRALATIGALVQKNFMERAFHDSLLPNIVYRFDEETDAELRERVSAAD